MTKIENPAEIEINQFDGISASSVYVGDFILGLELVRNSSLKWNERKGKFPIKYLTLQEIADQLGSMNPIITVIVVSQMSGEIYQWGNYGEEWWEVGSLDGYA